MTIGASDGMAYGRNSASRPDGRLLTDQRTGGQAEVHSGTLTTKVVEAPAGIVCTWGVMDIENSGDGPSDWEDGVASGVGLGVALTSAVAVGSAASVGAGALVAVCSTTSVGPSVAPASAVGLSSEVSAGAGVVVAG